MTGFWSTACALLGAGERLFVTLVVDHSRHSPGTRGARLLLSQSGQVHGTVGGGVMEKELLEEGASLLAQGWDGHRLEDLYHRRRAPGRRSGMICAGRQRHLSLVLRPERDLEPLQQVLRRQQEDRAGLLTWSPQRGLALEEGAPDRAQPPQRVVQRHGQPLYQEQLLELRRLVIFGGGHCGLALSRLMRSLGYVVTVAEVRASLPMLRDNEAARHKLVVPGYAQAAALVSHPEVTCAVVMTADFPSDTQALLGALAQPFVFVGLMGAPAKIKAIGEALTELGVSPQDQARITAPVGLPIGSSTPEEIAVSVAAQLIQLRPALFPAWGPSPFTAQEDAS